MSCNSDTKELSKFFPPVSFVFAGNKKVFLAPENYLFKVRHSIRTCTLMSITAFVLAPELSRFTRHLQTSQ